MLACACGTPRCVHLSFARTTREKSAALLQGATAGRCCHGTARSSSRGGLRDHLWWRVFLVLGARRAPLHRRARSAARCSDDRRVLCLPRGSRVPAAPLEHASMAGAGASRAARRGTPRSRRSDKASDTPAEVIDLTSPEEGRGSAAQAGAAGAGTRSAPQGGAAAGGRTRSERAKRPIVVDLCGDSPSPPPSKRARRAAAAAATAGQVSRRP